MLPGLLSLSLGFLQSLLYLCSFVSVCVVDGTHCGFLALANHICDDDLMKQLLLKVVVEGHCLLDC